MLVRFSNSSSQLSVLSSRRVRVRISVTFVARILRSIEGFMMNRFRRPLWAVTVVCAIALICLSASLRAQTTAAAGQQTQRSLFIKCGRLLDGKSDQARTNVVLVIEGEKIKEVGSAAAGSNVIDLSRETC